MQLPSVIMLGSKKVKKLQELCYSNLICKQREKNTCKTDNYNHARKIFSDEEGNIEDWLDSVPSCSGKHNVAHFKITFDIKILKEICFIFRY